jgi:serine/threonine protein kinase
MGPSLSPIEGKYEILAKLKEGGMGAIYKVRHRLLDEERVIKVLRPQFEEDQELKQRFAREARSAIKLRHPNVVQIFDFSLEETGAGLIVMEFIDGTDLGRLVMPGNLPSLPLALEIARQSLKALGFLHLHGFVHRDVSPDNLMLALDYDQRPLVKLIDLGIAKRHDTKEALTVSGSFLGKFRYASPEHFGSRGPNGVEARSDLYTFGLVFYELLTGRYPLVGEGTSQLIAAHLFQQPIDFTAAGAAALPPEVEAMAMKALAKEPEKRFEDAAAWIAEVELLQKRFPLGQAEVEEARRLVLATRHEPGKSAKPGSTQNRLDRHFGLETTPRPDLAASSDPTRLALIPEDATRISGSFEGQEAQIGRVRELLAEAESRLDAGENESVITLLRRAQQMAAPLVEVEPDFRGELSSTLVRIHRKIRRRPATQPPAPPPPIPVVPPPIPVAAVPPPPTPTTTSLGGGLLHSLAEIERLRIEGDVLSAWQLLKQAIETFGENPALLELRRGLAEDLLEASRLD